jgi:hypothetical protein
MLFGFVFMEKNTKNKKKHDTFEIPLPHISTMGALQNTIQPDLGSYSAGLQLLFLSIFGNWSCDHHPDTPLNEP